MESKDDVFDNKPDDKQQSQSQPEPQDDLIDDYVLDNFEEEKEEKEEKEEREEKEENLSGVVNEVISQVITEVYLVSEKTKQLIKKYDFLVDKINIKLENYKEVNQRLPYYTTPGTAITLNVISARNNFIYNKLNDLKIRVLDTRCLIFEGNKIDKELYENYIAEFNKITNNMCSIL